MKSNPGVDVYIPFIKSLKKILHNCQLISFHGWHLCMIMAKFDLYDALYIQSAVRLQLKLWLQTQALEISSVVKSPSSATTLQPSWEGKGREGRAGQNIYIVFAQLRICIIFTGRPPRSLSLSTKEKPCESETYPKHQIFSEKGECLQEVQSIYNAPTRIALLVGIESPLCLFCLDCSRISISPFTLQCYLYCTALILYKAVQ